MTLFEKYPKDVRKTIALVITGLVGCVLLFSMIFIYTKRSKETDKENTAPSKISQFYNIILEKGTLFLD